jgi:predicted DsbA family dithiol-disulfide isomerase
MLGDPAVLADLAEGAGIERSHALAFLSDPASFDAVIDDEKLARGLGLNGVPSFPRRAASAQTKRVISRWGRIADIPAG